MNIKKYDNTLLMDVNHIPSYHQIFYLNVTIKIFLTC